jgi:hypothetical protein
MQSDFSVKRRRETRVSRVSLNFDEKLLLTRPNKTNDSFKNELFFFFLSSHKLVGVGGKFVVVT